MNEALHIDGLLVLPRLQIQNANAMGTHLLMASHP